MGNIDYRFHKSAQEGLTRLKWDFYRDFKCEALDALNRFVKGLLFVEWVGNPDWLHIVDF